MRVETAYRTVVLQLNPDKGTEKELKKATQNVFKFIEMSRLELQNQLYAKFQGESVPSARTVNLVSQRFTGSLGEKGMLPIDAQTSKFVFDKEWFLEASVRKKTKEGFTRVRIPISKTEIPYYSDIQDMLGYPTVIVKENDKWFAYVSIKVPQNVNENVVGIDFNFSKWVASPSEGQPLFFDATPYDMEINGISKQIQRIQGKIRASKDPEETEELDRKIKELYSLRTSVVKRAHGNFLSRIEARYGKCTLVVERVSVLYKLVNKDKRDTNNWLYKKTSLGQFQMRAMAHGFEVKEINPAYTSSVCHRCGEFGITKGKHERIFECLNCGLDNYHRDLNAARNIAKVFEGTFPELEILREKKKSFSKKKAVKEIIVGNLQ